MVDAATRVNQKRANDELDALRRGQVVGLVDEVAERVLQFQHSDGEGAGGFDSAGVSVPRRREAGGGLVSIVSIPHAGRLEGASDSAKFEAIRPKIAPVASYCKSATCRCVTWKN